jgi:hypothetical protein
MYSPPFLLNTEGAAAYDVKPSRSMFGCQRVIWRCQRITGELAGRFLRLSVFRLTSKSGRREPRPIPAMTVASFLTPRVQMHRIHYRSRVMYWLSLLTAIASYKCLALGAASSPLRGHHYHLYQSFLLFAPPRTYVSWLFALDVSLMRWHIDLLATRRPAWLETPPTLVLR